VQTQTADILITNEYIDIVNEFKYLGVILDSNFTHKMRKRIWKMTNYI